MNTQKLLGNKTRLSYIGLLFVVFIWGISPLVTLKLYAYYSPTFRNAVAALILIIFYVIIARKKLGNIGLKYWKAALPFGICYSMANILQKIGLPYTTPVKYAFLENLSCVIVPIMVFVFARKKPTFIKIFSSALCLVSVFILNGLSFTSGFSFGIGEVLCAAAGLLYGINIAGVGVYTKDLDTSLYLILQFTIDFVLSLIFSLVLANFSLAGAAVPIEPIKFSFHPAHLAFMILTVLVISGACWLIRVNALKYVDPTAVGIIMPFSAIITSVASVIARTDPPSVNLLVGGLLGIAAIILSEVGDTLFKKKKKAKNMPQYVSERLATEKSASAPENETSVK